MISRYDENCKEPPFLTIQIDNMKVDEPEIDYLGEKLCNRLISGCKSKGYIFKFYTISDVKDFDYNVIVY